MEAEALESIFPDEFEQVSATPFHWRIRLEPHPAGDGVENHGKWQPWHPDASHRAPSPEPRPSPRYISLLGSQKKKLISECASSLLAHAPTLRARVRIVAMVLVVKPPPEYPNAVPDMEIEVVRGLSPEQKAELEALSRAKAEENLGMVMVYTLCEEIKEWLVAHNQPKQDKSMFAMMQRRELEKAAPSAEEKAAAAAAASSRKGAQVISARQFRAEWPFLFFRRFPHGSWVGGVGDQYCFSHQLLFFSFVLVFPGHDGGGARDGAEPDQKNGGDQSDGGVLCGVAHGVRGRGRLPGRGARRA